MAALVSNCDRRWWALVICLLMTGCSTGYRLQISNGAEILYHVAGDGHIRMIYQVEHGKVTIHDKDDSRAEQFMTRMRIAAQWRQTRKMLPIGDRGAAEALRIEKIKAAAKRNAAQPIYIFVHKPLLDSIRLDNAEESQTAVQRMQTIMAEEMGADQMVTVTPLEADAEIYSKAYFKKARAFNIHTRKIVVMDAFHFEVEVRSNYLPEDRYKIEEAGHWMENEWIIQRAAMRTNKILKKMIGPNIPADRENFLSIATARRSEFQASAPSADRTFMFSAVK